LAKDQARDLKAQYEQSLEARAEFTAEAMPAAPLRGGLPCRPGRLRLIVGLSENATGKAMGRISVRRLLTLSACNSGVGDNTADGKEVEGFGVLTQRQGAKAVIASLWPVADSSTSRLMQDFYRIRESAAGITKLEALRQAQLGLLRGTVEVR
jgi:CHAT domain